MKIHLVWLFLLKKYSFNCNISNCFIKDCICLVCGFGDIGLGSFT